MLVLLIICLSYHSRKLHVNRGYRELPIHPDFTGKVISTAKREEVKVEVLEVDGVDRVVIK